MERRERTKGKREERRSREIEVQGEREREGGRDERQRIDR